MFVSNQCTVLWYRMCNLSFFSTNPIMYEVSCMFFNAIPLKNLLNLEVKRIVLWNYVLSSQLNNLSTYLANLISSISSPTYPTSTPCCCLVGKSCLTLLWPHGLWPTRLLCPWGFPGEYWSRLPFLSPKGSSQPRDQTCIYCHWTTWESHIHPEPQIILKQTSDNMSYHLPTFLVEFYVLELQSESRERKESRIMREIRYHVIREIGRTWV